MQSNAVRASAEVPSKYPMSVSLLRGCNRNCQLLTFFSFNPESEMLTKQERHVVIGQDGRTAEAATTGCVILQLE